MQMSKDRDGISISANHKLVNCSKCATGDNFSKSYKIIFWKDKISIEGICELHKSSEKIKDNNVSLDV